MKNLVIFFGVTVLGVLPFFEKPCRRYLDAWGSSCEEEPLCDEVVVRMEGGGKVEEPHQRRIRRMEKLWSCNQRYRWMDFNSCQTNFQVFTVLLRYFQQSDASLIFQPSSHGLTPPYLEFFSLSIHIKRPGYRMNQSQTSLLQS